MIDPINIMRTNFMIFKMSFMFCYTLTSFHIQVAIFNDFI